MQLHLIVNDELNDVLCSFGTAAREIVTEISALPAFSTHVASQQIDRLGTDIEFTLKAIDSFNRMPSSSTVHELYNCINTYCDRIELMVRRLNGYYAKTKPEIVERVDTYHRALKKLRSFFLEDVRGRHTSADYVDTDGNRHRPNMHIHGRRHIALDAGRNRELDHD